MPSLADLVGSYTPLTRSGEQWVGACPFEQHEGKLEVIGDRWRCVCGVHAEHDDAIGFMLLAIPLLGEREIKPTLLEPTPPPPRYGLHRAAERPEATVLITDHRAAAKVAEAQLPTYLPCAWPDGGSRWDGLGEVRGRAVLLWPTPGQEDAMLRLWAVLGDMGCTGKMVEGVDLAGWTGSPEELVARARECVRILTVPAPAPPNPAPQVAEAGAPSPAAAGNGQQGDHSSTPSPPATAGPATEAQDERSAPDAPPIAEFPAEATKERPRKRRLRVAGGTDVDIPDPDDEPLPVEMGEDHMALRFAAQHGDDWRYVKKWNRWFRYDGDGWRPDETEEIDRLAVEFCRQAANWPEARSLTPDGRRKIAQRRTAGQIRDLVRHDRTIAATVEQWDSDPLLVGVPGGVFCVDTGKIIEGDRQQYVTKRGAVAPAHGKPKLWLEHMQRMMEGDDSMINFLHLYAGYCATGEVSQQCFAFLYGMGQTGKGTFLLTLGELMGDYAVFSEASTFLKRQGDKHLSELARFNNARLVIIDEVPSGSVWNEERIKRCTGGGKLTVNFMHSDPFDMQIKFKLAVAGNSKPQLRRVGKEMQRRIRLIKCNAMVPDDQLDQNFRRRMIHGEGPQIMNWILEGAVRWKAEGLPMPEGISDATRDYLDGEDAIGDWLSECTTQDGETRRPDAYNNFKTWFQRQGNDHAWGPSAWWSAMEDRGYTLRRTSSDRFVRGLSLKSGANL